MNIYDSLIKHRSITIRNSGYLEKYVKYHDWDLLKKDHSVIPEIFYRESRRLLGNYSEIPDKNFGNDILAYL